MECVGVRDVLPPHSPGVSSCSRWGPPAAAMDKENGDAADRGEKSGSAAGAPADAASLLDAASLFGECSKDD